MSKRLAVLGSPIKHSLSPQIQLAALSHMGIPATFERFETVNLARWVDENSGYDALSLTMPLKEDFRGVAANIDPVAERANSANYLLSNSGTWSAFNTDVFGIQQAIKSKTFSSVGILGTGATARSALVALDGRNVTLWGRNSQVSESLAKEFGTEHVDLDSCLDSDLVISTLPADALTGLISGVRPGILLDVVYSRPSPKGFSGYISGLEMLIWQAIGQLRLLVNGSFEPLGDEELLHELMMAATEMAE